MTDLDKVSEEGLPPANSGEEVTGKTNGNESTMCQRSLKHPEPELKEPFGPWMLAAKSTRRGRFSNGKGMGSGKADNPTGKTNTPPLNVNVNITNSRYAVLDIGEDETEKIQEVIEVVDHQSSTMEGNLEDNTALHARIQQLERERDDLHKDIEQLCMQQAGPAYLGVATRMHLHRTAALEQEIENLKKKLAACTRENQNLQEELSEAYHVKSQLADLHSAEVSKNIEAEKQLKFFQGCVASAFAERDNAVMEAEKAMEQEESNSRGFYQLQERVEKISCELLEEKALTATLQSDLEKQSSQLEVFREVITYFEIALLSCISWFSLV
nr:myosin heavy chain, clone 203-like isoform X1 [Ipomoea batatas]